MKAEKQDTGHDAPDGIMRGDMEESYGVLFDLDGTLLDSAPDICTAIGHAMQRHGFLAHPQEDILPFLGSGAMDMITGVLATRGITPNAEDVKSLTDAFIEEYCARPVEHSRLFDGAKAVLEALRCQGVPLGLCTNKPSVTCLPVLKELALEAYFDVIMCGDYTTAKKPDPRHILETLDALQCTPERAIMVGDTINDMHAARAAGVMSVGVTFGYHDRPCADLGADILITHLNQLEGAIQHLFHHRATLEHDGTLP